MIRHDDAAVGLCGLPEDDVASPLTVLFIPDFT
jgi:hypothetical protein